jgi:hypothetical protein
MPAPTKVMTPKKSPLKPALKSKKIVTKVKRIENGRIAKAMQKKVKSTIRNGRLTATMIVTSRKKVKQPKKTPLKTISKPKGNQKPSPKVEKKTTTLGKRKRTETPVKGKKKLQTPVKDPKTQDRKISKPKFKITKTISKKIITRSPAKTPVKAKRIIHDSVSGQSSRREHMLT